MTTVRSPEADLIAQLVSDPSEADTKVQIVGGQVVTATPADVGKVVTVDGDGNLVLAAGTAGGIQSVTGTAPVTVDNDDPDNPVVELDPSFFIPLPAVAPTAGQVLSATDDDPLTTDWIDPPSGGANLATIYAFGG